VRVSARRRPRRMRNKLISRTLLKNIAFWRVNWKLCSSKTLDKPQRKTPVQKQNLHYKHDWKDKPMRCNPSKNRLERKPTSFKRSTTHWTSWPPKDPITRRWLLHLPRSIKKITPTQRSRENIRYRSDIWLGKQRKKLRSRRWSKASYFKSWRKTSKLSKTTSLAIPSLRKS